MSLHVFTADNEEWVVAASPEDAAVVYASIGADPLEDVEWTQLPDDKPLTLFGYEVDEEEKRTMTCAEWVTRLGRCYLGSVNV